MYGMRWLTVPTAGVLGWAMGYEAALAAGVVGYTGVRHPPPGESATVLGAALLMAVAGIAIAWIVMLDAAAVLDGIAARAASMWSMALIPCIASAAVVAHWLSPDPYYLPNTFRRMSDGGIVEPREMAAVLVLAAGSAVVMRIRPSAGLVLCAISLW